MEDLAVVAFGCLLHDIGKIVQRADETPLRQGHSRFGADLLQSAGLLKESKFWYHIFECVRYHHWRYIKEGASTLLAARIAHLADAMVSDTMGGAICDGEGRPLEEVEYSKSMQWDRHRRLDSVFLSGAPAAKQTRGSFPLAAFDGRKISQPRCPYPDESRVEERAPECYSHLRDLAISPLVAYLQGRDPRSLDLVNDVSGYLEGYLRFIPSEPLSNQTCYLSLYDHLKLTSAVGSALLIWLRENYADPGQVDMAAIPEQQCLLLIVANLNGVKQFLLDNERSSLSDLKHLGAFIELLLQWLSEQILRALGLSGNNLLLCSGTGFTVLAANTPLTLAALARMQARLNEWLLEEYGGALYFTVDCAEISGAQLHRMPDGDPLAKSPLRMAAERREKLANEPFRGMLSKVFSSGIQLEQCSACDGDRLSTAASDLCAACRAIADLESKSEDLDEMLSRPYLLEASPGGGAFPAWNNEAGVFEPCSLSVRKDVQLPPAPGYLNVHRYRQVAHNSAHSGAPRAVWTGQLSYPPDAAPAAPKSLMRELLQDVYLERFFRDYTEELRADRDFRQYGGVERILCSASEFVFAGPADKLLDFAVQLQQRLHRFSSGACTLSAGMSMTGRTRGSRIWRELASKAVELGRTSASGMSVSFEHGAGVAAVLYLNWHDWRREVRPLVHDLHKLKDRSPEGHYFWNLLLDYLLTGGVSFYRVLYSLARIDERAADLRADPLWQRFKRHRIIPLGSKCADARQRQVLAAALMWLESTGRSAQRRTDEVDLAQTAEPPWPHGEQEESLSGGLA